MTRTELLQLAESSVEERYIPWLLKDSAALGLPIDFSEAVTQLYYISGAYCNKLENMTEAMLLKVYDTCSLYNFRRGNMGDSHKQAMSHVNTFRQWLAKQDLC
jgi:hypothetical protein